MLAMILFPPHVLFMFLFFLIFGILILNKQIQVLCLFFFFQKPHPKSLKIKVSEKYIKLEPQYLYNQFIKSTFLSLRGLFLRPKSKILGMEHIEFND